MRLRTDGKLHEIEVTGTKVLLRSVSYGQRADILRGAGELMDVKGGKLVNAGRLTELIYSIDGRTDVEAAINDIETAQDLLDLIKALVSFSTITERESKNFQTSSNGKPAEETPTGLSRVDEVNVAAELTALRKDG